MKKAIAKNTLSALWLHWQIMSCLIFDIKPITPSYHNDAHLFNSNQDQSEIAVIILVTFYQAHLF